MPSYLEPLSPISPLCKSLVGLPWTASDCQESNVAGRSRPRLPARPSTARASTTSALRGPRAPHCPLSVSNENENRRPRSASHALSSVARPLPAPPPCTSTATRRGTYRPLPRPPCQPVAPPPTPLQQVANPLEYELLGSRRHTVLRLDFPDSPEPGIIIVSPLTGTSDLSVSSISQAAATGSPSVDETGRWTVTYEHVDVQPSQRPTLPRIDTNLNASKSLPSGPIAFARPNVLSPIENYYDKDSAVLSEVDNNRPRCRPTDESYVFVDGPLPAASADPPSPPRKSGHARIASDLSKKLKRYSCKWIREKKGRRWVEEDYGTVLQKLRRLK
ncbi:uncharacterized protein C8Q71DRAFT_179459 [Rhodofomes roseus]|uniref:Uncharacterized protein n=1 Tax=Rhodofomes roseus TaxID=34475 RepID=A0ABQ8K9B7_9APHY|nr:uncharacterized protein C8Q71DRAFT_179459 [Rhodofomes roseus]KAH9833875.1 hypothetical protein C8Q71DRAFT_179459 [Rhodofomes roseus]